MRRQKIDLEALFSADPAGPYYYDDGWNKKAIMAFGIAAVFSVATVWVPALASLSGFGWVIGALLGGMFHIMLMRGAKQAQTT